MIRLLSEVPFSSESGVTFGIVIVVVGVVSWLYGRFGKLEVGLRLTNKRLDHAWMQEDQHVWAQKLDNANKDLRTPSTYTVLEDRASRERKNH